MYFLKYIFSIGIMHGHKSIIVMITKSQPYNVLLTFWSIVYDFMIYRFAPEFWSNSLVTKKSSIKVSGHIIASSEWPRKTSHAIHAWRTWDHWIIQVSRDHGRPLVQLPAQSRDTHETRSRSSGLGPVTFWKPPRTEMVQPLWAMCSTVGCPHGSTVSPYIVLDLSCFKLWLLLPALPPCTSVSFTTLQKLTNRTLTLSLHLFADFLFFQWKYGYL